MTFRTTNLDKLGAVVGLMVFVCLAGSITSPGYAQFFYQGPTGTSVSWQCRTGFASDALEPVGSANNEYVPLGTGSQDRQIFLWDEFLEMVRPITNTSGSSNPRCANIHPSTADDEPVLKVAFVSNRDNDDSASCRPGTLCPCFQCIPSPNGYHELYLWVDSPPPGRTTPSFHYRQITHCGAGQMCRPFENLFPSISSDGTRVAFIASRDYLGTNPDRNFEIFLWGEGQDLRQVTHTMGPNGNFEPAINWLGTRIAFSSQVPDGISRIQLYDIENDFLVPDGIATAQDGLGSFSPAISWDGTTIAFHSDSDLTGGNPDRNFEIFRWTETDPVTISGTIDQITDTVGGGRYSNFASALRASVGPTHQIAFVSNRPTSAQCMKGTSTLCPCPGCPGNNDGNHEIFLWTESSGFRQITNTRGTSAPSLIANTEPAINGDGSRISFISNRNVIDDGFGGGLRPCFLSPTAGGDCAGNADGNYEIFVWVRDNCPGGSSPCFLQVTDTRGGADFGDQCPFRRF